MAQRHTLWLILSINLAACGAATSPAAQPAPVASREAEAPLSERVAALMDPEQRFYMPTEGAACEGPADADVTIVEFMGYQCPFSRRLEPTVRRLQSEHPGRIRLCVRHYVIDADQPFGRRAAYAAIEVRRQLGDEAFFRAHRELFDSELSEATMASIAARAGLGEAAAGAAWTPPDHAAVVLSDGAALVRVGQSGTPNTYISGRHVAGAQPYEAVQRVLLEALAEAERLRGAGVAGVDLYAALQANATREVVPRTPRPGEPARVRIRFITVGSDQHALVEERRTLEEARAIATRIAEQVAAGEDFGALAREWSVASNAVRGGEFGWITPETLTQEVWDLAIGLDIGAAGVLCGEIACAVYQRQE